MEVSGAPSNTLLAHLPWVAFSDRHGQDGNIAKDDAATSRLEIHSALADQLKVIDNIGQLVDRDTTIDTNILTSWEYSISIKSAAPGRISTDMNHR